MIYGLLCQGMENCGVSEFNPLQDSVLEYFDRGDGEYQSIFNVILLGSIS